MKKYLIALLVIVLVLIVAGAVYFKLNKPTVPAQVACTMEAKLCPDGVTSVGRQGPKCEFAPCPVAQAVDETTDWKTYKSDKYGFEFKYPREWKAETRVVLPWVVDVMEHPDWGGASGGATVLVAEKKTVEDAQAEAQKKAEESISAKLKYGVPEIVTIAGATAIKRSYQPFEIAPSGIEYIFPEKGLTLVLTDLYTNKQTVKVDSSETQKMILSTFKFTK